MCIGAMAFPNEDATIPGVSPARSAMSVAEDPAISGLKVTISSPAGAASGSDAGASAGGDSFSSAPNELDEFDEPTFGEEDDPSGGTKKFVPEEEDDPFGSGNGGGDIVDENDPDDSDEPLDTDDPIVPDDPDPNTSSAARILSPLIRAVQGERPINRRGRNELFIPFGKKSDTVVEPQEKRRVEFPFLIPRR